MRINSRTGAQVRGGAQAGSSGTPFIFGGLGLIASFSSTITLGWILTFYQVLPQFAIPILIQMGLGNFGILFALATGAMRPQFGRLTLFATPFVVGTFVLIAALASVLPLVTQPPQAISGLLLNLPALAFVLTMAFFGVEEWKFWGGMYATFRSKFPGLGSLVIIMSIMILGGVAFHFAASASVFAGTIFGVNSFLIFVGVSWAIYGIGFEISKVWAVGALSHLAWNLIIALFTVQRIVVVGVLYYVMGVG